MNENCRNRRINTAESPKITFCEPTVFLILSMASFAKDAIAKGARIRKYQKENFRASFCPWSMLYFGMKLEAENFSSY